ncbi:NAD(P)H-binding protein [Streptomyces sp. NPDC047023]|uniref:NAD(P)-dependent oxidoreductase n=1 Tax=Streptomyces sp. NPDC047023 TaxID=3155139 RepID=UPI0033F2DBED
MNITVIGASAGVGLESVKRALEAGHSVTTLSRSTDSLPEHPSLRVVQGSALDVLDVTKAIEGADAVLVALGTGNSTKATTLYTDAAAVLVEAAAQTQTTAPFITVTGFGAGDSSPYQGFIMRTVMKTLLGKIYENKTSMEQILAASGVRWEMVRPGRLTSGPRTGSYRVLTHYTPGMSVKSISRADVADYLVREAEQLANLGRYPALTY